MQNYTSKQKQIVIVETDPLDQVGKIAKVLKEKGYKTISLSIMRSSKKQNFLEEAYDQMETIGLKFFKPNLKNLHKVLIYSLIKSKNLIKMYLTTKKLNPYVVIARPSPHMLCVLAKFFFRKYPVIYYPYDIKSNSYDTIKDMKKAGISFLERKSERYCFRKFDGIAHKGHEDELNNLNKDILGKDIKITAPIFQFLPYCMKELIVPINKNKLSKNGKNDIHFVYTGCLMDNKNNIYDSEEAFFIGSIEETLKGKLHLHIYMKHGHISRKDWEKRIGPQYEKFKNNKYYHVYDEMGQRALTKEISKYDYGVWLGSSGKSKEMEKYNMGNKFSTYLEAGIPAISFRTYRHITSMGEKYGIGIGITFDQIKDLKKILKKIDYDKMTKNIKKTRSELEIRNHIPKLEKFFEEVRAYKYKNLTK